MSISFSWPVGPYTQRVSAALDGSERLTSWYRWPAENARVGGHPWSQHQVALGTDWATPNTAALVRRFRGQGLIAVDEFDHVHVQAWPAGTLERLVRR